MDKSHFRILNTVFYGENYIDLPGKVTVPDPDFEVTINGKVHRFAFDPSTDDPAEGATLVGVRYAESVDVHQLSPSRYAEPAAWDAAAAHYGLAMA